MSALASRARVIRAPSEHSFDSIIGHEPAIAYLQQAIANARLPHALLIHGDEGVGKLSLAYALAKELNGGAHSDAARRISAGIYPDVQVVEPTGATGQLTLAGWKPTGDDSSTPNAIFVDTAPMESGRKVLILRHVHRMNLGLANYLLKLIEEPPSYLSIVLLSESLNEVLPTIRSRCAPVRLSPLPVNLLNDLAALANPTLSHEECARHAEASRGCPGVLLEKIGGASGQEALVVARTMSNFRNHGFVAVFRAACDILSETSASIERVHEALTLLESYLRELAMAKIGALQSHASSGEEQQFVREVAEQVSFENIFAMLDELTNVRQFAGRQTDAHYVIETYLMRIGQHLRNAQR